MTVAALEPFEIYNEDGVTLDFAAHWRFLPGTLVVTRRLVDGSEVLLTEGPDYSVTGGDTDAGGEVTLVATVAGAELLITRDTPVDQQMDYDTLDTFPAESHERALDKLTLIAQENKGGLASLSERALRVPIGEVIPAFPAADVRKQHIAGFDGLGNPALFPADVLGSIAVIAQRAEYTATAGQTNFPTFAPYVVGYVSVFVNGAKLGNADFTATNGTDVELAQPCAAGDVVSVEAFLGSSIAGDAAGVQFIQAGAGAVVRSVQSKLRERVSVEDFGAVGDGVTDCTAAILAAIQSLRANPKIILDTIGGNNITAYSSGTVVFGRGIYLVQPNVLLITQDLGLTLEGQGSRRMNNAVRAATTLVAVGAGDAESFIIKQYRNGARGLTIRDMDICYADNTFLGSVVDTIDSPHLILENAFLGTFGLTAPTRFQTARACVRATYSEGITCDKVVFDGAKVGFLLDDVRTELGNSFGGSQTRIRDCWFYDFADNHVYHGGTRTHEGLLIEGTSFNPIAVGPSSSCINVDNIDGINLVESGFGSSVGSAPASQWARLTNCTGQIRGCSFLDLAASLVVSGMFDISGNKFAGTAGPTLQAGIITGKNNEFAKGSGWLLSGLTGSVAFDLGPDLFKAPVTRSYDIPADNAFLAGRIIYDRAQDLSVNQFRNTSSRVAIAALDGKGFDISTTPYTISILDTGRAIAAIGGVVLAWTMPVPVPGTRFTISKLTNQNFSLACSPGTNFYGAGTTTYTLASIAGTATGTLTLTARGTVGWTVAGQVGAWTYS